MGWVGVLTKETVSSQSHLGLGLVVSLICRSRPNLHWITGGEGGRFRGSKKVLRNLLMVPYTLPGYTWISSIEYNIGGGNKQSITTQCIISQAVFSHEYNKDIDSNTYTNTRLH